MRGLRPTARRPGRLVAVALAAACGSNAAPRSDDAGPAVAAAPAPKTSAPTDTAIEALKKVKEPRALVFLPPGPVADQVVGYLTDLGRRAEVPFEVREIDRLIQVEEARRFRVVRDGVIVLVSGDVSATVEVHPDAAAAAGDLARLDRSIARALHRLGRGHRPIALLVHQVADVERYHLFGEALAALGFATSSLTPGKEVPAGAVAIFLDVGAGPTRPAMESIDRHLAAGGAALVAVEPRAGASLGPLEARLGLALATGTLLDPESHAVARKDESDLQLIATSGLGAHASLASLARMPAGTGLLFAGAGALVERGEPAAGAARAVTVRSMKTAFLDGNGDNRRGGREAARPHPIAAAVSGRFKAIVVADATWLSDDVLRSVPADAVLLADAVRWLAGEEELIAEVPEAPATGDQLISYPLRTSPAVAAARGALWKVAPDGVHGVRYESRGRMVLLERKSDVLWGRVERLSADGGAVIREFPLGPEGAALFARLAAPTALRTVGPLDATTRARYALEEGTLTVDLSGGATKTVLVGSRVMGSNDRYAADPSDRVVVILPAALIDPLDQSDRLALRKVLELHEEAVTRMVVGSGDHTREAMKGPGGAWKVTSGTDDDGYLAGEIARSAFRLVPIEFAGADRASSLTPAGKLTFFAGSGPAVDLEIWSGTGDAFWIATRLTRGLARVSPVAARRIADAIAQLVARE